MKKYIGKHGSPVVEFELEDLPKIRSGELTWPCDTFEAECWIPSNAEGEVTHYRLTAEATKEWLDKVTDQQVAEYRTLVEVKFETLKAEYLDRAAKSPDPRKGIQFEITELDETLNGTSTEDLSPIKIQIREAWRDIAKGNRYTGRELKEKLAERRKRLKIRIAQRDHYLLSGGGLWRELTYVDKVLRSIYVNAEATNKFLEWLQDYQQYLKDVISVNGSLPQDFAEEKLKAEVAIINARDLVEYFTAGDVVIKLFRNGNNFFHNETEKHLQALKNLEKHDNAFLPLHRDTVSLLKNSLPETLPENLNTFFDTKFNTEGKAWGFLTKSRFAKHEIERLNETPFWQDNAKYLPIAQQWLDYLQSVTEAKEQPNPVADTSTASQESKDGKGAENGVKLTQRQVAYFLAYKNAGIRDPRSDDKKLADVWAKKLCKSYSPTTGEQLYSKFDKLRSAKQRQQAFNSQLDSYKNRDSNNRAMKATLLDIETIIPLLTGEAKTEAENDLKNWNTMYSAAIE